MPIFLKKRVQPNTYFVLEQLKMGKAKEEPKKPPPPIPFVFHGLFGGTAGALAMCIVQPMDMIKTRMQLLGTQGKKGNVFEVTKKIIKKDGFRSLWDGLSCAVLRQYTYGLTRFTVFYNLFELYKKTYGGDAPNLLIKGGIGLIAGACGAIVGNPAEVALIRMTADGSLPQEKKKGYKHVFDALSRIIREEGLMKLWIGVEATVTRAMIVTASELGSYSQAREIFLPFLGEGIQLHFAASMVAGLVATAASLPVDIIKTRVQNTPGGSSQIIVLKNIIKTEGVSTLWAGFLPTYGKLGPHAVITFVLFEQCYVLYWYIKGKRE